MLQVYVVGYGSKSRSWFLLNPVADIVQQSTPTIAWRWDVGRSARDSHPGLVPVFRFNAEDPDAIADGVTVYELFGALSLRQGLLDYLFLECRMFARWVTVVVKL